MYKFLASNGQRLAFGIGTLIIVIFLLIVNFKIEEFSGLSKEEQIKSNIFNFGLNASIFLIVATTLAMIGFGIYQIFSNFKKSYKGLIGFGALALIFVVAYMMASGEATGEIAKAVDKVGGISPNELKFISAGVTASIIISIAAFGTFILAEVRNFFK
jgi:hypothetical protein